MNRGVVQSSPVQQMMAGNPTWWNINSMRPPPPPSHHHQAPPNFLSTTTTPSNFLNPYSSYSLPFPSWHDNNQELPESWSQLLMGGVVGEEDKANSMGQFVVESKNNNKLENWEEDHQMLMSHQAPNNASLVDVKQESSVNSYVYGHHGNTNEELLQPLSKPTSWSPNSCVTSFTTNTTGTNNMLDFSNNNNNSNDVRHPPPDRSSECNSSGGGGALKKARVQPSTAQSTFKVRKEKLGDRITALHQLVSPFGKTDTASVLLEAIGYIRFLQSQIEALSLPYLSNGSGNSRHQHSVQGEKNCIFPEDPGQLLNENCLKRKAASEQESQEEPKKDLRSRGLCLVPVSCTLQVGSDNGADYWAPALGGGFR